MNNTINHVSDSAQYVTFEPTGDWSPHITNVQAALAAIRGYAVDGLPVAQEGVAGIAPIATQEEVDAGLDHTKIVTPKTLAEKLSRPDATKTQKGITRFATTDESLNKSNENLAIGPDTLDHFFVTKKSSESVQGTIKICTLDAARSGTDDETAVSPLKMRTAIAEMIPGLIPEQNGATEDRRGLTQLATPQQALAGTLRENFSVSPYAFANARATETQAGTVKVATAQHMSAGTDDSVVVTAKKFAETRATNAKFGTVKLSDTVGNLANTALSANAQVLPLSGGVVTGDVYKGSRQEGNQFVTKNEAGGTMPIASIILSAVNKDVGNFMICNGRALRKSQYPDLFREIGYTYGGSGENFNLPDMRGLVARGFDAGRGLDSGRSFGSYQADAMQPIRASWVMDDQAVEFDYPTGAVTSGPKGAVRYDAESNSRRDAYKVQFDSSRVTRTANETRVKSLALNYIIRVR